MIHATEWMYIEDIMLREASHKILHTLFLLYEMSRIGKLMQQKED